MSSSREAIKMIEADGWILNRIRGSHHHFTHPTKPGTVTIQHPKKDLTTATFESIKKQAGLK